MLCRLQLGVERCRDAEMQGEDANFFHHWENICAEQLAPGHYHQGNECCETTVWVRLAESSGTVTLLSLGGLEKLHRVSRPSTITSGLGKIMLVWWSNVSASLQECQPAAVLSAA